MLILRSGDIRIPPHVKEIFPLMRAHRMSQVALNAMVNIDKGNILTVLHNTQRAKCTDPRDRLYAILGIVDDVQDVEIDYSISVEKVYRRWAMRRIQRTKSLDILSACASNGRSGNLPSWVPDLRNFIGQDKILWLQCHGGGISRMQRPETKATFSENEMKLSLVGQKLATISLVGKMADITCDGIACVSRRLVEAVEAWEQWCDKLDEQQYYPERNINHTRLQWTIGRLLFGEPVFLHQYEAWKRHHRTSGTSTRPAVNGEHGRPAEDLQIVKEFERWIFPRVHGCQIFNLDFSLITLGIIAASCGVKENDELFLLEGALTPLVLRREGNVHRVIGPCFVSGLMSTKKNARLFRGISAVKVVLA